MRVGEDGADEAAVATELVERFGHPVGPADEITHQALVDLAERHVVVLTP